MGAGKSTVGRRLARRLGLPFVDSDVAIEEAAGVAGRRSVRTLRREAISATASGGWSRGWSTARSGSSPPAAARSSIPRTRELLNERAITVWLDAPVDVLGRAHRRAATPGRCSATATAHATLARLADERRPIYAEAHIHIRSGDGAHGDVVEAIVAALATSIWPR